MGVDYLVCANCGETFPDAGSYVSCGNCGEVWCSHDCAEEDGHKDEHCAIHPDLESRSEMEAYRAKNCDCDDCTFCDNYVPESCGYCRNEKFNDSFLLLKALELLGISEETFLMIVKSEQNNDDNWINHMRLSSISGHKPNLRFMLNNCPYWHFSGAQKDCNSQMKTIEECIACWHEPFMRASE